MEKNEAEEEKKEQEPSASSLHHHRQQTQTQEQKQKQKLHQQPCQTSRTKQQNAESSSAAAFHLHSAASRSVSKRHHRPSSSLSPLSSSLSLSLRPLPFLLHTSHAVLLALCLLLLPLTPSAIELSLSEAPSGIWSSFQRVEGGGLKPRRPRPPDTFGVQSVPRRTQATVKFSVLCDQTAYGEALVAVGNCEALGDNEAEKGLRLFTTPQTFPLWEATTMLPAGCVVEYTYGILQPQLEGGKERMREVFGDSHTPRRLQIQHPPSEEAILLVTDLDGTLLGDEEATKSFFAEWNKEYQSKGSFMVYNTGRPLQSVMALIENGQLQRPSALICSEGTEVFWFDNERGEPELDLEWQEWLSNSWQVDSLTAAVEAVLQPLQHTGTISKFLSLPHISGQPMLVIAVTDKSASDKLLASLEKVKANQGLAFDVVLSSSAKSWYLLLVPPGASKGSAALHAALRLGFPPHRMMVAGDAENDIPLFEVTESGARGVLVGNAVPGLRQWAEEANRDSIFCAVLPLARGILQGLREHWPSLGGGGPKK